MRPHRQALAIADLTHGPVTVIVPEALALAAKAGQLTPTDILRLTKAPAGIGLSAELTAQAMEQAGAAFTPPSGVTPALLRQAGERADGYDGVLLALDVLRARIQQENLLADAECWRLLRQVNDMVKGQVNHHPELAAMFAPLKAFMTRKPHGGAAQSTPDDSEPGPQPIQA